MTPAQAAPNHPVELTAHSAGFCGIPGVFPCGPQLTGPVGLTRMLRGMLCVREKWWSSA
jgi:hypothetical protein